MTRVSLHSHFCPVSHNTALSSRQVALQCASGGTRHKMHKLGTGHNGTYISGNAHIVTSKCAARLALVGEYLSFSSLRLGTAQVLQVLLEATLLPPLASPAPPAPPLGPDHLQRKHLNPPLFQMLELYSNFHPYSVSRVI